MYHNLEAALGSRLVKTCSIFYHTALVCVNKCYLGPVIIIVFKIGDFHKQQINLKFCVKSGNIKHHMGMRL